MPSIQPPDEDRQALSARAAAAEARAAQLQTWFDVMVETSPMAMGIISGLENRFVRANQPLADLFGMTLQRREEELRHAQKIDGIGRLAAGIAHDLNNLLTIFVGHGEMLPKRFTPAQLLDAVRGAIEDPS